MKPLLFLDRDGVINRFPGKGKYVTRSSQLKVLPQALKGLRLLTEAGFPMVVISNQGCVSRGLITRTRLQLLTRGMLKTIKTHGGSIRKIYYCMHQTSDACACKKPKIKLLEAAVRGLRISRKKMYFLGDSQEDVQAARNFGCRSVLLLSGRTKARDVVSFEPKPNFVKKDLWEAAKWLQQKKS